MDAIENLQETIGSATYSPEDNKLRLYPRHRLDAQTYARVRAAGFIWAPKQDLFVAPMWTPGREDLLIELAGSVDDEDSSLVDRAADRAERFEDYSDKRAADAESARKAVSAIADNIPLGQPILIGHHSERHARRDQEKIRSGMQKTIRMWETSEYWKDRAAGAIRHAKYKERPDVRARRIKKIEADRRRIVKSQEHAAVMLSAWRKVASLDNDPMQQRKLSLYVANSDHSYRCFTLAEYPRDASKSQYEGEMSLWTAIDREIITPSQAAALAIPSWQGSDHAARWLAHYDNRIAYERAMLEESGGTVTDRTGPEVGGAVQCWASPGHGRGWAYIKKVNKVTVTIHASWGNGRVFSQKMPFDKLSGVMTAAAVKSARDDGSLHDTEDKTGFYLFAAPETRAEANERVHQEHIAQFGETTPQHISAMKTSLKAGIKIEVVPQLFPTPTDIGDQLVSLARVCSGDRVLEPSAGTGALIEALMRADLPLHIVAIEINSGLVRALHERYGQRVSPPQVEPIAADFLEMTPERIGLFPMIIMNPPFVDGADIKHINHARKFLEEAGLLVAICAAGPRQRAAFEHEAQQWIDLPEGSFKDTGTNVRTAIVVFKG